MTGTLRIFAPAKINLFLHILGRNPNGYHQLQTIFQLLNWGDWLEFELLSKPQIELISDNCTFPPQENLVYHAAKLLQEHYYVQQGVRIHLDKHLPAGAGLGGGSSDAGATLRALNQLWQLNLSTEKLIELGATLGADVPVFVLNQHAWGEGIGEHLTPLNLPKQWYVILNPACHVSTKALFAHPDLPRNTPAIYLPSLDDRSQHPCWDDSFILNTHNDFETLACQLYPEITEALAWLKQFGPARLTGSGCCLFLAVASKAEGEKICQQVPKKWTAVVCESL